MAATTEAKAKAAARSEELARELGFTKPAVAEFFKILGEQDVPEEKIATRLVEIATHFTQTRDALASLAPDDPHAAELARSAKTALDRGRLAEADGLLTAKEAELAAFRQARELKQRAQEAEDRHALNAAKLIAGRGSIALTQLRYTDAADRFKEAAALVPEGHTNEKANYLSSQAAALYRQGDEMGDNAALRSSIAVWEQVLEQHPRDRVPLDWAQTQNNLGIALERLGERESGTARLEEAVAAFRAALEERTRERVPLDWAMTQNNLGNALRRLGERESGTAHLEEAVAAYRAALEERTRERVPLDWAMTQNNLGIALETLGERESGTAHLEEAVAAIARRWRRGRASGCRSTGRRRRTTSASRLRGWASGRAGRRIWRRRWRRIARRWRRRTRERVPLDWAMTQNNLGNALWEAGRAGERDGASGGGGGGVSRGAGGADARAGAARLGDDAEQPRHRA